jgi:hypothetical protein
MEQRDAAEEFSQLSKYLSLVLGLVPPVPKVVCELRESRKSDSSVSDILRPDK